MRLGDPNGAACGVEPVVAPPPPVPVPPPTPTPASSPPPPTFGIGGGDSPRDIPEASGSSESYSMTDAARVEGGDVTDEGA